MLLAQFGEPTDRATALAMDAADPLAHYKSQFFISDPGLCYLDGNSLGRMPKRTIEKVNHFLTEEWGTELVDGWSHWIDEAQTAGNLLGRATLGAAEGQTLVQDTTSVNFYQLCVAAIKARPGRKTVIIDSSNFPTDRYILAGIADEIDPFLPERLRYGMHALCLLSVAFGLTSAKDANVSHVPTHVAAEPKHIKP